MKPLVSTIITTKNEADVVGSLLKSIKNQSYQNLEIIVVDNDSTDDCIKIAKKYTNLVYSYGPERSAQRNFGAKKSNGEFLFFLDADMELTKAVVEECVNKFNQKEIGAVIIPERSKANNFWGKVKAFERSFYNAKGDQVTDAARFFKRSVFKKSGGYDQEITGPEDWDLPERIQKMGYQIVKIKSQIIHKERINSPMSLARKKFYYGLTSHRYLKKHGISWISPKTLYFLRPVFYRNWRKLFKNPILSLAMAVMLLLEFLGGGLGFILGRFRNE